MKTEEIVKMNLLVIVNVFLLFILIPNIPSSLKIEDEVFAVAVALIIVSPLSIVAYLQYRETEKFAKFFGYGFWYVIYKENEKKAIKSLKEISFASYLFLNLLSLVGIIIVILSIFL